VTKIEITEKRVAFSVFLVSDAPHPAEIKLTFYRFSTQQLSPYSLRSLSLSNSLFGAQFHFQQQPENETFFIRFLLLIAAVMASIDSGISVQNNK
jgi:hypothetical protein